MPATEIIYRGSRKSTGRQDGSEHSMVKVKVLPFVDFVRLEVLVWTGLCGDKEINFQLNPSTALMLRDALSDLLGPSGPRGS